MNEAFEKTRIFKGLSSSEKQHIWEVAGPYTREFARDEILVQQGDKVFHIGVLISGGIFSEKYHIDGRAQIISSYFSQDILNLTALCSSFQTSPTCLRASASGHILWIPYANMITDGRIYPSLRSKLLKNILQIVADDSVRDMYHADVLSSYTTRDRILKYLSIISEKRGRATIDIGMTQDEFARYLCVDRSTLTLELTRMRREKIIDYKGSVFAIVARKIH